MTEKLRHELEQELSQVVADWWRTEWLNQPSIGLILMEASPWKLSGHMKSTIKCFPTWADLLNAIETNLWPPHTGQKTASGVRELVEDLSND
jgi:hypothetical protein